MNATEHLLTALGEEGVEVAKDCCKALRFGINDRSPSDPKGPTNAEKLVVELNDLIAVAQMLSDRGVLPKFWMSTELQAAKTQKVMKYMAYARRKGTLK